MVELSEAGRRLIDALIGAPVAWQGPEELARALDWGVEEALDVLADLDAGGWLEAWARDSGLVVTLSVEAASALAVRLVEFGADEVPRGARRDDPGPPALRASGVFRSDRAAALELVADAGASVELEAERFEGYARRPHHPPGRPTAIPAELLPRPTRLIGTSLVPWPGPGDGRKASCPACRSKRLDPSAYCLYCDRWGLDHLIRGEAAPPSRRRTNPEADARRVEQERLGRKEKLRRKLAARVVADRPSPPNGRPRRAQP